MGEVVCDLSVGITGGGAGMTMELIGPGTLRVVLDEESPELLQNGVLHVAEPLTLDAGTAAALGAKGTIPPQLAVLQPDDAGLLRVVDLHIEIDGDGDGGPPEVADLALVASAAPMEQSTFLDNEGNERAVTVAEVRLFGPAELGAWPPSAPAGVGSAAIEYTLYVDGKSPCTFLYRVDGDTGAVHKLAAPGTSLAIPAAALTQSGDTVIGGSASWPPDMDACWTAFVSQFRSGALSHHLGAGDPDDPGAAGSAVPWEWLYNLVAYLLKPTPAGICSTTQCTNMGQWACAYTCCPAVCRNETY